MTVLNIISRTECDMQGIPLDWERCRACGATGLVRVRGKGESGALKPCPTCDGHGSLREAVRAALTREAPQVGHVACAGTGRLVEVWPQADGSGDIGDRCHCVTFELRCEGCGHPMSEGTWENAGADEIELMTFALNDLRRKDEVGEYFGTHYSRCDEGCRHGGPFRVRFEEGDDWTLAPNHARLDADRRLIETCFMVQASWRPVDVRTLDWPHDLRPEMLAVLCLRCLAAR